MSDTLLQVQNLRTWFETDHGPMPAVDGIDFEVSAGRTLGIVGESGSGKSLTALSIMGLIDPPGRIGTDTRILFEGRDLTQVGETALEQIRGNDISMIFQEPMTSLNPVHKVGAQIAEVLHYHNHLPRGQAWAHAEEMLRLVGIPEPARRLGDFPHQMSGGMRQRVMIAIALACSPKLLIADEPTTALDVTIQAQILELITDLQARTGMAIMLITHDLGVVAETCDDVVVMYAGRIVERGAVKDVFSRPQHPYTEGLLRSIPLLGMTQEEPLHAVPGTVPSPGNWPSGCRFAPRCEYAFDRCTAESPPSFSFEGRAAECWLCEHGSRSSDRSTVGPAS